MYDLSGTVYIYWMIHFVSSGSRSCYNQLHNLGTPTHEMKYGVSENNWNIQDNQLSHSDKHHSGVANDPWSSPPINTPSIQSMYWEDILLIFLGNYQCGVSSCWKVSWIDRCHRLRIYGCIPPHAGFLSFFKDLGDTIRILKSYWGIVRHGFCSPWGISRACIQGSYI